MSEGSIDLNINNYTNSELLQLLDLDKNKNITPNDVNESIQKILSSSTVYSKNIKFHSFLIEIRNRLLNYIDEQNDNGDEDDDDADAEIDEDENAEIDEDAKNDYEDENTNNDDVYNVMKSYKDNIPKSSNIINRRYNSKIGTSENDNQYPIIDKRLPIQQTHNIPLLRGQINPNLVNTYTRLLHIDSQYRQDYTKPSINFTIDLDEPIYKAIKMSLTSIEIKRTWYTFDSVYGTNAFICNGDLITIPPGNYNPTELMTELNNACSNASIDLTFTYNGNNGKVTVENTNSTTDYNITFYDSDTSLLSQYNELKGAKINSNLGVLLGLKEYDSTNSIKYLVEQNNGTITGNGLVDTYGPKYILLGIEEFNNNKINRNIIGTADNFTSVNMPEYYNCDISLDDPTKLKKIDPETGEPLSSGLTTAQAFTITEVVNKEKNTLDNKYNGTLMSNVFARISVANHDNFDTIIVSSNSLKNNQRNYMGPIDIKRLKIQLYNDKGQIINLNNGDFSFAVEIEELYQY